MPRHASSNAPRRKHRHDVAEEFLLPGRRLPHFGHRSPARTRQTSVRFGAATSRTGAIRPSGAPCARTSIDIWREPHRRIGHVDIEPRLIGVLADFLVVHVRHHADHAQPADVVVVAEADASIDRTLARPQATRQFLVQYRDVGIRILHLGVGEGAAFDQRQADGVEQSWTDADRLNADRLVAFGAPVDHQLPAVAAVVSGRGGRERGG